MGQALLIIVIGLVLLWIIILLFLVKRYIKVPQGKLMVIYGKTGSGSAEVLAGGATFVWPVIQEYKFLDLAPLEIEFEETYTSKDNITIPVKSKITFAISNREDIGMNAADRLLGLEKENIKDFGSDIIKGVMRITFEQTDIVSIATSQDKVRNAVAIMINKKINMIGLELINMDLKFSKDGESYLKELEQKFKEKKANSFEIGNKIEDEKQLEILNQKIIANAEERKELIEEKLNLLVRFKNKT